MRTYKLPLLSGLLLALVFYPFYIWPLALVALAPFFYFAWHAPTTRMAAWGGFMAGMIGVTPTLYFSLFQLVPQPGAWALTVAVRASSVGFLLINGALFALIAVICRTIYTSGNSWRAIIQNAVCAALVYLPLELLWFAVFQGYYYCSLAYALAPLPLALRYAAWGSVPLVAFLAVFINALVGLRAWRVLAASVVVLTAIPFAFPAQVHYAGSLKVAMVQVVGDVPRGEAAVQRLADAAQGADVVIYPFSIATSTIDAQEDARMGAELAAVVPASTTVVAWNTSERGSLLYDELALWRGGVEQIYQKHALFALSDYTPWWAGILGLRHLPYTITPGEGQSTLMVDGVSTGVLICSELHNAKQAAINARGAGFILSVGWDGMFPGELSGDFSVAAAQFRAAENGVPVVRAMILGPSVIIGADGSVQSRLPYGTGGVLHTVVYFR